VAEWDRRRVRRRRGCLRRRQCDRDRRLRDARQYHARGAPRTHDRRLTIRRARYNVAASLDGYIADANGAFDWIPDDATVDFATLFARVDTYVMGRLTYETVLATGAPPWKPEARVYVVSRTLAAVSAPGVTIVHDDPVSLVDALRHEAGDGEIWLFGGGQLFATLLAAGQVDTVEITVVPVLLGGGVSLLGHGAGRTGLTLTWSHVYPSGMVALHYDVPSASR
jgi:dihydrofolate reductase